MRVRVYMVVEATTCAARPRPTHPNAPLDAHDSFLAVLAQRSPKHADALEMTKLFHQVNFAQTLGVNNAVRERACQNEWLGLARPAVCISC